MINTDQKKMYMNKKNSNFYLKMYTIYLIKNKNLFY